MCFLYMYIISFHIRFGNVETETIELIISSYYSQLENGRRLVTIDFILGGMDSVLTEPCSMDHMGHHQIYGSDWQTLSGNPD